MAFAALAFLVAFTTLQNNATVCTKVNYTFARSKGNRFVDSSYVAQLFASKQINLVGSKLSDLNLATIEDALLQCPEIADAQVSTTLNGHVNIAVTERVPIVRIMASNNNGYYLDNTGALMPLSNRYTAHVPIATGAIVETYASLYPTTIADIERNETLADICVIDDIFQIINYINADTLWAAQIAGIEVLGRNNFNLIPLVGNHTIVLGNALELDKKFSALAAYYRKATTDGLLPAVATINLKYNNQVIITYKTQ